MRFSIRPPGEALEYIYISPEYTKKRLDRIAEKARREFSEAADRVRNAREAADR